MERAKAAVLELGPRTKTHCVGVGEPCPNGTKLRKSSTGNLCARCRDKLVFDGLVGATRARHHVQRLSAAGVGYKTVADAAGVTTSVMGKIRSGERKKIRASTERRILEVDTGAAFDRCYVDAGPTQRMIERLIRVHGYTKTRLALELGSTAKQPSLQLRATKVTVRNAAKVKALYDDAEGVKLRER
jgi:hypothetical protein